MDTGGSTIQELFEEMKNDYEIFCRSAQRFMDSVKEQQETQPVEKTGDIVAISSVRNCRTNKKTCIEFVIKYKGDASKFPAPKPKEKIRRL